MTRIRGRSLVACMVSAVILLSAVLAKEKGLDEGLVDPAWFGPGVEFHKTQVVDYLWVKGGFTARGKKLKIEPWSDPLFLGKKRDAKDSAKAFELTETMPGLLRGALSQALQGIGEVSKEEGEIAVTGRFVDCNAGSKAAKFMVGLGAGSAAATWDIKLTDRASGEVVAAVHHRAISGTYMSEINDKIIKWLEEFGKEVANDFPAYRNTSAAKD